MPAQEAHAEEAYSNENTIIKVAVANMNPEYGISDVQPITTLLDCEIIMAFKMDEGLCMSFTTASMGIASVIGVKDIKVQQKCGMVGKQYLLPMVQNSMIVQASELI